MKHPARWLDRPVTASQVTHRQRLWLYGVVALIMAFLVLPTLIVIPMSFSASQYLEFPPREWSLRWYRNYFGSPAWMQATATSLKVAVLTSVLATPLGTLAAYGLHTGRWRGSNTVSLLLLTPLVVPGILVAIGVFYAFVQIKLVNSMLGLVLAHSMLAIPVVTLVVGAALKSFDPQQEMVARSLGAPRWQAFWLVTLPQIRFSVISSAVLAFLTSFDEIIVALFIAGGDHSTLTRNMFNALRDQIDPTIAAISTLIIAVTSVLLIATQLRGGEPGAAGH